MTQNVTVSRVWQETPEILALELTPLDGKVHAISPGAHIDVHLGGNLIRQYSLWNGPSDDTSYRIGVKLEPQSRGGSAAVHKLKVGDQIEISEPRNNFELMGSDGEAIFLAGGIGVTPLLAMAQSRKASGKAHCLHFFTRDAQNTPFQKELSSLSEAPIHMGLQPTTLEKVLRGILEKPAKDANLYICGPGPFMDLAERLAFAQGWSGAQIHLERFSVDPDSIDKSGDEFEVILAQSGQSVTVQEGETILEAVNKAGIEILTSCEQGVCGTCMCNVIEGEPDHRDDYLSAAEKAGGKVIMPCVSRSKSARLVLDL